MAFVHRRLLLVTVGARPVGAGRSVRMVASNAMLTMPNANVIERFGSAAQKRKYLQALFEGHAFAPWR
jgi:alkylation response protein AidB-like acyl-CoA dehydrogenase